MCPKLASSTVPVSLIALERPENLTSAPRERPENYDHQCSSGVTGKLGPVLLGRDQKIMTNASRKRPENYAVLWSRNYLFSAPAPILSIISALAPAPATAIYDMPHKIVL